TLDPGVVQSDAVTVDEKVTMNNLKIFMETAEEHEREERWWLEGWRADIVCLDACFLPARIAKKLGIPAVIISNFTFDAIYSAMAHTPEHRLLVQKCIDMYRGADHLLRLPGHIPIPSFADKSLTNLTSTSTPAYIFIDIPLVVRLARLPRSTIRASLSIPETAKVVLITFGGHELVQRDWTAEKVLPEAWIGIVIAPGSRTTTIKGDGDPVVERHGGRARLKTVDSEEWYLPDLINACDVVLSKCGYGMCSEVVAHSKPLIYVPRPSFVEEPGLLRNLMEPYGHALKLEQTDFWAGKWAGAIERAFKM
ncbi:hypothetical protein HK102_004899, partial [Quaeritorhiza haematococci]